jgi:16S rRNA (uracil1498-N3)-methyltransferase
MADRFYCPSAATSPGGLLALEGDEARHLGRVRRVGVGQVVEVFDGRGFAVRAEVVGLSRDSVTLRAVGPPLPGREPGVELTLATAVPKGERFDWLVEKATEVGVARLVPVVTARSVVEPGGAKLDRLRRVVVEASKQCGRNRLLAIEPVTPWAEFSGRVGPDILRLLSHPGGTGLNREPGVHRTTDRVVIAVGPEGGFTEEEVTSARAAGWVTIGLGPTILRVETAGLVAASLALALLGHESAGAG